MKYTGPHVKVSRRLSLALTPKAGKFMERKPYPPGQHGQRRKRGGKISEYKRHLLEKQRLRAQYNLHERQFRNYIRNASGRQGVPEDNLVRLLETRLDAVVLRSGLAKTIYAARQYVNHKHILVNGKWVNIPSYRIKVGDQISVKTKSIDLPCFIAAREEMVGQCPGYLDRSKEKMTASLRYLPKRDEVPVSCDIQLVFEYYSK